MYQRGKSANCMGISHNKSPKYNCNATLLVIVLHVTGSLMPSGKTPSSILRGHKSLHALFSSNDSPTQYWCGLPRSAAQWPHSAWLTLILNYIKKLLLACQVFRGLTSMKEHIYCVMSACELWSMQWSFYAQNWVKSVPNGEALLCSYQ